MATVPRQSMRLLPRRPIEKLSIKLSGHELGRHSRHGAGVERLNHNTMREAVTLGEIPEPDAVERNSIVARARIDHEADRKRAPGSLHPNRQRRSGLNGLGDADFQELAAVFAGLRCAWL